MVNIMREYHRNLQKEAVHENEDQFVNDMNAYLEGLNLKKFSNNATAQMSKQIDQDEITGAIQNAKADSAPGLDGIPYNLWKKLLIEQRKDEKYGRQIRFNILEAFKEIFHNICKNELNPRSNFTEGWMCLIPKKGDMHEPKNYRPITCLNTDYKLLTKIITSRLAKHINTIIDKAQAGFVPRRQILDQTDLIQVVISYAETEEVNGLIIALDQEKAYNRITHQYLWHILEHIKTPKMIINTIKNLYQNANTKVLINRILSDNFDVRRGVQQGDPLSCLLFIIAIEPLLIIIRQSGITGIKISHKLTNLIRILYADNTTVVVNKNNDLNILKPKLDKWCNLSGAKFNENKMEFIPIGTKQFRSKYCHMCKLNNKSSQIPDNVQIAEDG
jgi:hypothetical protein